MNVYNEENQNVLVLETVEQVLVLVEIKKICGNAIEDKVNRWKH